MSQKLMNSGPSSSWEGNQGIPEKIWKRGRKKCEFFKGEKVPKKGGGKGGGGLKSKKGFLNKKWG